MKIEVDGVEILTLSDTQKKVIKDSIDADAFDADMKKRINAVLMHQYDQCFKRLKANWDPKLVKAGVLSVPVDRDAYAQLVFANKDYKDCSARELELKNL